MTEVLLLPMMFFTGLNNTFYAAWFTRQILSCHTGLVLLALGAGEMVGAYCTGVCLQSAAIDFFSIITRHAGKIADSFKNGQKMVLFAATGMQAAALYLSWRVTMSGSAFVPALTACLPLLSAKDQEFAKLQTTVAEQTKILKALEADADTRAEESIEARLA